MPDSFWEYELNGEACYHEHDSEEDALAAAYNDFAFQVEEDTVKPVGQEYTASVKLIQYTKYLYEEVEDMVLFQFIKYIKRGYNEEELDGRAG